MQKNLQPCLLVYVSVKMLRSFLLYCRVLAAEVLSPFADIRAPLLSCSAPGRTFMGVSTLNMTHEKKGASISSQKFSAIADLCHWRRTDQCSFAKKVRILWQIYTKMESFSKRTYFFNHRREVTCWGTGKKRFQTNFVVRVLVFANFVQFFLTSCMNSSLLIFLWLKTISAKS